MEKARDRSIDTLKAFGIVCVVLGHISDSPFHNYLYTFHVPLFFFASGMLYRDDADLKRTLLKKFRILWSYVLFWIVSMVIYRELYSLFTQHKFLSYTENHLLGLLLGGQWLNEYSNNYPIWYLQCFFAASLVFVLFMKLCRNDIARAAVTLCIGYFSIPFQKMLPLRPAFRVDVLPIAVVFMACGYFYNKYYPKEKCTTYPCAILLILFGRLTTCGGSLTSIGHYSYYVSALLTVMGFHILLSRFEARHGQKRVTEILGRNTLYIMGLHAVTMKDSRSIAKYIFENLAIDYKPAQAVTTALISIAICVSLAEVYKPLKQKCAALLRKRLRRGEKSAAG